MYVFTNISIFYSGIMGRLIVISDGTLLMVLVFYIPIHSNHAMIAYLMLHMGQKYSRHCSIFDMGWRLLSNIAQSSIKITKIQRVFSIFSSRLKKEHNLSAKAVWQTRRYQLYSTTEFSFFFSCRPSHGNKTPYRGMSTLRPVSSPTIFFVVCCRESKSKGLFIY